MISSLFPRYVYNVEVFTILSLAHPSDFPTQCTSFEILFRLFQMARSSENMAILLSITQHFPLDVFISQSSFISDQRSESVPIHSRCQRRSESLQPTKQHPDHKPPALSALRRHFQSGKLARFRLLVDSIIFLDHQAGSRQGNRVFLHRSEALRRRIPRTAAAKHPVGLLPSISSQLGLHSIHRPHRLRLFDSNSIHSDAQHRQRRSSPLFDRR